MVEKEIVYTDGATNVASLFYAKKEAKTTLVCLPAMGVRASFYNTFAKGLSTSGYNVITIDWRGKGKSSVRASRKEDFGYQDLINDLEVLFTKIDTWFPNNEKIILGHSLGGQIGSLFTAIYPNYVNKLVLITSGSVYYKGWKGIKKSALFLFGNLSFPFSKILGYFPGNIIGFGGKEAKRFMKDFSYNVLTGNYIIAGFDYELALKKTNKNILSITVKNDYYISSKSESFLLAKFNLNSNIEQKQVNDSNIKDLNHFNWTKNPEVFIRIITHWI